MFVIEDEWHCEQFGEFETSKRARFELERFAKIAWDEEPNAAPCMSWRTCGRRYWIIEYDEGSRMLSRQAVLDVSSKGVEWLDD